MVQCNLKHNKTVIFDTKNKIVHYFGNGKTITLPLAKLPAFKDADFLAAIKLSKQMLS